MDSFAVAVRAQLRRLDSRVKVTANGVGIRYDLAGPPDAPVVTLAGMA